jgi:hypothetical protein
MGLGGDERKIHFMSIGERIGKTAAQDHVHARGRLNDIITAFGLFRTSHLCSFAIVAFINRQNPNLSSSLTSFYLCFPTLTNDLWLLIDPVKLALLVFDDLALGEPQCDLLLCVFDAVGAVADVAADIL